MPNKIHNEKLVETLFHERRSDRVAGLVGAGIGAAALGFCAWKMAPLPAFLIDNPGVLGGGAVTYGVVTLVGDRLGRTNDDAFNNELKPMKKSLMIKGGAAILSGLILMGVTENKGHVAAKTSSRGSSKVVAEPNIRPGTTVPAAPKATEADNSSGNRITTKDGRNLVWYLPAEARSYGDCADIKDYSVEPGQTISGIAHSQLGPRGYTPEEIQDLQARSKVFSNKPDVPLDNIQPSDRVSIYCPPPKL